MGFSSKKIQSGGFTIIELIIVIVVIGILITIGIVSYNSVQKQAIDKGVVSDADGVSGEVTRYQTKNQGLLDSSVAWYSGSGTNSNIQFTPTKGDIVDVVINSANTDYCIRIYNATSKTYTSLATAYTKESSPGTCAATSPSAAAIAVSPLPLVPNSGNVTTLAGGVTQGTANGTGSGAQFISPTGIVADSLGNVFVSDYNSIRKITPAGVVTSFAGSTANTQGSANGTGAAATFYSPANLAIDSSDNIYVADYNNNLIRKITPAGVVTTVAGITGGSCLDTNGALAVAKFCQPYGIAIDSAGIIYVSDIFRGIIREISPSGTVSTLAGSTSGYVNGTGVAAKFSNPNSLAVDSSGNVYVADYVNNVIRKITSTGVVTTFAGNQSNQYTQDGTGTGAAFSSDWGITIDSAGTLYVTDYAYIRKITTPGAVVTTLSGSGTFGLLDGPHNTARFAYPHGIGISGSTLYVADSNFYAIRKLQ